MAKKIPAAIVAVLDKCDIKVNGDRPCDIQLHDERLWARILANGTLGAGEAYMEGWWDCEALDECVDRLLRHGAYETINRSTALPILFGWLQGWLMNLQSVRRAFQVGEQHYDIGNDVFAAMLDKQMIYSCGHWQRANNLEQAQTDKLDMICRKLELQPGETLLDIGCGWGGLAAYAARHYDVSVVGLTISQEQQKLAREKCADLPIEIRLEDYRSTKGAFDKIVSVGMFEHVGYKNYQTYFDVVKRLLKPNGLFLLHTIGGIKGDNTADRWINRYIFPNGSLPSTVNITTNLDNDLVIEDWHNFGRDYDKTLMAWLSRFETAWPDLRNRYDERFQRMWRFYLMSCAGFFRARRGHLWQLVISHQNRRETYRSMRPAIK